MSFMFEVPQPPEEADHASLRNTPKTGTPKSTQHAKHTLSKFALLLTNSTITLNVGNPRVKYHVSKHKLQQLPFFQGVLEVESVNMFEDDPEGVAALIEWLYFRKYTYDMNELQAATLKLREAPEELSEGLLEGLFHLEVCIVASKYQCAALFLHAKDRVFQTWINLNTIDALRLWQVEKTSGLSRFFLLPLNKPPNASYSRALVMWVEKLFIEHHEEASEIIRRSPDLAIRLLENCASGSLREWALEQDI